MGLTGYTDQVLGASMKYDVMHPLKPIFLTIVGKILNVIHSNPCVAENYAQNPNFIDFKSFHY